MAVMPDSAESALNDIWRILTQDNVACSCCDSDIQYIDRVNEVADVLGLDHWDGTRAS